MDILGVIGQLWGAVIVAPMINSLVLLYYVFFSSFGLSIVIFTVIIRAAMIPLTVKQSRQMKAMSALQPKMKNIQAKYGDDKARVSQETMRLYKENGVNPIGCLGPLVIQMPIFIGLFWALRKTLPSSPERLADLSRDLYSWLPKVNEAVPLDGTFFWMDLGKYSSDNPFPILMPVLVGASMWMLQKTTSMPSATPQQASTNRMMLWMMPIMFGIFTLNFEAGLALYWVVSNIVGIVIQGFVTGWDPLISLFTLRSASVASSDPELAQVAEEVVIHADDRSEGQNIRGGHRDRPKGTRRRTKRGRNKRR